MTIRSGASAACGSRFARSGKRTGRAKRMVLLGRRIHALMIHP
jgi:hypothetical protein